MIDIIQEEPSFLGKLGKGLSQAGQALGPFAEMAVKSKMEQQAKRAEIAQTLQKVDAFKKSPEYQNLTPMQKFAIESEISGLIKGGTSKSLINAEREEKDFNRLQDLTQPAGQSGGSSEVGMPEDDLKEGPKPGKVAKSKLESMTDAQLRAGLASKSLGPVFKSELDRREGDIKRKQQSFEGEREYHTKFSKAVEDNVAKLRESVPKKENALSYARNAIEAGNPDFFSKDKLADATGLDIFRTSKGAQLITAGKENLLSNMSRTSARAQNMWFEQRLNSMFAKIEWIRSLIKWIRDLIELMLGSKELKID
jgi:hypothetical protein